MSKKRALFLDRDGTIIYDTGYPKNPEEVCLLPWVGEALLEIQKCGFMLIIISNQSGIGRGYIARDQAEKVHNRLVSLLTVHGISINASYYCPHSPEEICNCRKPLPEMIFRAAEQFDIDLSKSFMVGDRQVDIETGKNAGCHTILLSNESVSYNNCFTARDWKEIENYILAGNYDN